MVGPRFPRLHETLAAMLDRVEPDIGRILDGVLSGREVTVAEGARLCSRRRALRSRRSWRRQTNCAGR